MRVPLASRASTLWPSTVRNASCTAMAGPSGWRNRTRTSTSTANSTVPTMAAMAIGAEPPAQTRTALTRPPNG